MREGPCFNSIYWLHYSSTKYFVLFSYSDPHHKSLIKGIYIIIQSWCYEFLHVYQFSFFIKLKTFYIIRHMYDKDKIIAQIKQNHTLSTFVQFVFICKIACCLIFCYIYDIILSNIVRINVYSRKFVVFPYKKCVSRFCDSRQFNLIVEKYVLKFQK